MPRRSRQQLRSRRDQFDLIGFSELVHQYYEDYVLDELEASSDRRMNADFVVLFNNLMGTPVFQRLIDIEARKILRDVTAWLRDNPSLSDNDIRRAIMSDDYWLDEMCAETEMNEIIQEVILRPYRHAMIARGERVTQHLLENL